MRALSVGDTREAGVQGDMRDTGELPGWGRRLGESGMTLQGAGERRRREEAAAEVVREQKMPMPRTGDKALRPDKRSRGVGEGKQGGSWGGGQKAGRTGRPLPSSWLLGSDERGLRAHRPSQPPAVPSPGPLLVRGWGLPWGPAPLHASPRP